jgi:3',5'-cyclic AMP phosphodiesterase CpdA
VCLCFGGRASAERGEEPVSLVSPGSQFDYIARTVELPAERYSRIALHDLDSARGKKQDQPRPSAVVPTALPPASWRTKGLAADDADRKQGQAPLASKEGSESCNCKTVVSDSSKRRLAVLYTSHRFTLPEGTDPSRYDLLDLRVAYRDGLKAYLNGVPIATRNLDRPAPAAARARGPEWESFLVPLRPALLRKGENVLSVEVRPARNSHGVRFDASLSMRKAGQVVRGPIVQQVTSGSALLLFDTDLPTQASVSYGPTKEFGSKAKSAGGALARHHRIRLAGLKAGQAVHYRLEVAGVPGDTGVFHAPPAANEPLRFAVYGDMRGGHRVHGQIVESLLDEAIDFVVVTGDLVLRGSDEADWQRFFDVARPLLRRLPYYPVAGNHDLGKTGDERLRMNEIFSLWPGPADRPAYGHWYSFDLSGVHFVMLDSNSYRNEEQRSWLEKDLQAARKSGSRAIFAAVHAGPFSRGLHRGDRYAAEHYAPILAANGVTLLFSGHDHLYQRGEVKGLNYMVSGGGGAPLYSVRCGIKGKKRCKTDDGMQHVAKEHHYILVTVYPKYVEACPKRVDKSPLEACVRYPI